MATQRVTLPIFNLGCGGGGALMLEQAVARTPGVIAAYVNPATEMAYITFDAERCTRDELASVVAAWGLRSGPINDPAPTPDGAAPAAHGSAPGDRGLASQFKRAELTGSIGAGVLGAGVGLLLPAPFAAYALPILILGGLMHGWGMRDKQRLERSAGRVRPAWAEALYWGCWIALLALGVVAIGGLRW